jgi:hypothetical protein
MAEPNEPEEGTLAADRWVRIMADYCADGVWARDGCGGCADELPVDPALIARIRAWQEWYDTKAADFESPSPFDVKAFAAEGLAIARAVKAALPDWTVMYFDEAALPANLEGVARHVFEYEITLSSSDGPSS